MPAFIMCPWHFLSLGVGGFGAEGRKEPKDTLVVIFFFFQFF